MGLVPFKTGAVQCSADTFVVDHPESYRDWFSASIPQYCEMLKIATFAKPENTGCHINKYTI